MSGQGFVFVPPHLVSPELRSGTLVRGFFNVGHWIMIRPSHALVPSCENDIACDSHGRIEHPVLKMGMDAERRKFANQPIAQLSPPPEKVLQRYFKAGAGAGVY